MQKYKKLIWFTLDNAAKLYPAVLSSRTSTLFRLSADFAANINVSKLQNAVDKILDRLSYYKVSLEIGFFWYYYEHNNAKFRLQPDSKYPCGYMPFKNIARYPFRIRVYANRIALEISHALSDGTGALALLKLIIYGYLTECGHKLPYPEDVPDIKKHIADWEFEDSFKKYYLRTIPRPSVDPPAFHLKDKLISRRKYIITSAELPADKLVARAKMHKVSVTVYLLAVYFQSFILHMKNNKIKPGGPLRMMVPVNLRKIFPSRTMLNFFLTIGPEIDPRLGDFSFDEICAQIHHFMAKETNPKLLLQQISRNVGLERFFLVRAIPLFLKNLVLPIIYVLKGQNLSSSSLSNLGIVKLHDEYKEHVKRLDFIPAPSKIHKINCGVLTYNNKVYINFGRLIKSSSIERLFFTRLVEDGISVKVHTNEVL